MKLIINRPRRDGKFPITLIFPGQPNGFGGHYPDKRYNKLYSQSRLAETIEYANDWDVIENRSGLSLDTIVNILEN